MWIQVQRLAVADHMTAEPDDGPCRNKADVILAIDDKVRLRYIIIVGKGGGDKKPCQ